MATENDIEKNEILMGGDMISEERKFKGEENVNKTLMYVPVTEEETASFVIDDPEAVVSELTRKPDLKYKFKNSLAHGGMKTILRMNDKDTARDVAMAVLLHTEDDQGKEDFGRFVQEARITANLEHPNIVPVHDIGVDDQGFPYFTMKLIKGESLATILKKLDEGDKEYIERYDITNLLLIFRKICNAIGFAHSKRIVHLDLTPENIQVGRFGEVLVLDWGLAKVLDQMEQESDEEMDTKAIKSITPDKPMLTLDGVIKGTPGYMAPEQAAGLNSRKNEQTDIYALGALLYTIVTWKNPIENKNKDVKQVLKDTIDGNIVPPRKRVQNRLLASAVEAIIQKAMAVNPSDRYQSVIELRDDIDAYISGFATRAEQAGLLKRNLLFIKRNKNAAFFIVVIMTILAVFGHYVLNEEMRQRSGWIKVFETDFTDADAQFDQFLFQNRNMSQEVSAFLLSEKGLLMRRFDWLWLKNARVSGENVKVVVTMRFTKAIDGIDICLNSTMNALKSWRELPRGYSCLFGGFSGNKNVISKNEEAQEIEVIKTLTKPIETNKDYTVEFQRSGEILTLTVNKGEIEQLIDPFPLFGSKLCQIGFRGYSEGLYLKSLEVYRLALPEKASPLIAGDALVEAQHFEDAINKYLTIAENYANTLIAEKALMKAYFTASTKLKGKNRDQILAEIDRIVEESYPNFNFKRQLLELDALTFWRDKDYRSALDLLKEVEDLKQNTRLAVRFTQIPHEPLPKAIGLEFLGKLADVRSLKNLNIANLGLESLKPLEGLSLNVLDCSNNAIEDIDTLSAMPLRELYCGNNRIHDLTSLGNTKSLEELDCSYNPITDLAPLANLPLKSLNLAGCDRIIDYTPLESIPTLEHLVLPKNLDNTFFLDNLPELKKVERE